jgi:2-aminoadipate transaminase
MTDHRLVSRPTDLAVPVALAPAPSGLLKLSVGNGSPATLPDLTAEAVRALGALREEALQYGPLYGLDALRDGLVRLLAEDGIKTERDAIIVVNGGKQALELVARALLAPGDLVALTAPTFLTAIAIFGREGATFLPLPLDEDGMRVDLLEETLTSRRAAGLPGPKLVFDMPDFHNPTGVTMSLARRRRLLDLAEAFDFTILEDDPYRRIRFEGAALPPIRSLDPTGRRVVGVGTMAKMLAPGLKVGWVNADPAFVRRLGALKMDGGSSPLTQRIVADLIDSGRLGTITQAITAEMRAHRDALVDGLERHMPALRFRKPAGGYFLWGELPDGMDGERFAEAAARNGVALFSGVHCFAGEPRRNTLRLCYSVCTPTELEKAAAALGATFDAVALGATFDAMSLAP